MEYSFSKFSSNGNLYYLATTWSKQFTDVTIVIFDGGACYNGSVSVKDFENLGSHVKTDFKDFWKQSLSIWNGSLSDRRDSELEVKQESESSINFVWKKLLPGSQIKQRLGSTNLKRNTSNGNIFLDNLLNVVTKQKEAIDDLRTEKDTLTSNYQSSLKVLDELANLKENIEKDLYSKFVLILNEKKKKIRSLKAELEGINPGASASSKTKEKPKTKAERNRRGRAGRKMSSDEETASETESESSEDEVNERIKRLRSASPGDMDTVDKGENVDKRTKDNKFDANDSFTVPNKRSKGDYDATGSTELESIKEEPKDKQETVDMPEKIQVEKEMMDKDTFDISKFIDDLI